MSLTDIKDKVRAHVLREIWSEPDAVYLLVEIRKILEPRKKETPRPYPSLWLHCDWSVHPKLTGLQAQELVKEIDRYLDKLGFEWQDGTATGGGLNATEFKAYGEILGLQRFRTDLRLFLDQQGFSTKLCDRDERWVTFLQAHAGVISDVPLTCSASGTKVVDELSLSVGNILAEDNRIWSFPVEWQLSFKGTELLREPGDLAN